MKGLAICITIISVFTFATSCSAANRVDTANSSQTYVGSPSNEVNVTGAANTTNASPATPVQPVQTSTTPVPDWLLKDLEVASQVHFPVTADTYSLNWNAENYANGAKPFNVFAATKQLWIGGYTGKAQQNGFMFYSGPFNVSSFDAQVKSHASNPADTITPVYMLESGDGVGALMPAVSIDLGNGEFLAFGKNQIIAKSDHAGLDTYVVYAVQGIEVPQ